MNVIAIDGVEYVKAGIIAKQYKYTADYVGQLCRSRKVDAKLIGRTWYVNSLSLTSHKTTRYAKENLAEKTIENIASIETSRLDVEPVARKSTIKISSTPANFLKRIEWQPLKYETDEAELNPNPQHLDSPVKLDVDLADSANLKISSESAGTIFKAEPLPEVTLSGTLNLSSLDIDFTEENIASSEVLLAKNKPKSKQVAKVFLKKIETQILKKEPKRISSVKEISEKEATYQVGINEGSDLRSVPFTPAVMRKRFIVQVDHDDVTPTRSLSLRPAVLIFILGLGLLIAVYFLEFEINASAQNFTASWQINTSLVWPF